MQKKQQKGAPPKLNTEEEVIHYFIGKYYQSYDKNQDIRFNIDQHIEMIEGINETYQAYLKKKEQFDYEKYKGCFMECIDFLTKVISKKQSQIEQSEKKMKFLSKLKK